MELEGEMRDYKREAVIAAGTVGEIGQRWAEIPRLLSPAWEFSLMSRRARDQVIQSAEVRTHCLSAHSRGGVEEQV